ncbi:hypothetical protein Q8A67_022977 [Cirrhinus molitorella]|uniref:Uncharacterized protein n=1 Tax=Cirrhinus molitorella TaxID=172907 RepID=A0AA88TMC7_9TELE|nr:hypothetical protein Q8A67_022977 [Cirrhinus molitorella]
MQPDSQLGPGTSPGGKEIFRTVSGQEAKWEQDQERSLNQDSNSGHLKHNSDACQHAAHRAICANES